MHESVKRRTHGRPTYGSEISRRTRRRLPEYPNTVWFFSNQYFGWLRSTAEPGRMSDTRCRSDSTTKCRVPAENQALGSATNSAEVRIFDPWAIAPQLREMSLNNFSHLECAVLWQWLWSLFRTTRCRRAVVCVDIRANGVATGEPVYSLHAHYSWKEIKTQTRNITHAMEKIFFFHIIILPAIIGCIFTCCYYTSWPSRWFEGGMFFHLANHSRSRISSVVVLAFYEKTLILVFTN